ncbi:gluconate 2-dehydrogenase subunit 3 family protein [Haloterrigena alkaliphila]|uniref:Gluconate 2-dehydrogenase subunit 3 family protein n=1 Tax=Haloterrigena alkaliphila TaxID=2816475 RepID=A0A8A2V8S4_9EURY|nr:gluconate 2-dehydrogenase subunit 3 family protein [Haloterrigena alkaliphila]QSW98389.1 gluconate 2-dehydrogenase subunit 3 family protein [Haloterrigena alkaliphila]
MGDNDEQKRAKLDFTRDVSRRRVMRAGGGLAVFGIAGTAEGFDPERFDVAPLQDVQEVEVEEQGLEYFTIQQARVVHDLTARIYPSDENGPGAPEAGVVYFIDEQMNSAWGRGERWYMQSPFAGKSPTDPFQAEPADAAGEEVEVPWSEEDPAATQGWQYALTPNEAYDQGIHAIEEYVAAEADDAESFTELDADQQDAVVAALEADEVETFENTGIDASGFFLMVRQNTLEGMFSDPMHGGNREMIGWRLKGFPGTPGALGSYRGVLQEGEYIELEEDDFRKLADDIESLGIDGENEQPANDQSEEGHAHVHNAAEADYPNIVDEAAARGDADGDETTRLRLDDEAADEGGDR